MDVSNPREVDRNHRAADCTDCGGEPEQTEIVNRSMAWHDGEVICAKPGCCRFVRDWDAG